jgi:hypothetical protein
MASHALTPADRLTERRHLSAEPYLLVLLLGAVLALMLGVLALRSRGRGRTTRSVRSVPARRRAGTHRTRRGLAGALAGRLRCGYRPRRVAKAPNPPATSTPGRRPIGGAHPPRRAHRRPLRQWNMGSSRSIASALVTPR